ncbi:hypothetical protein CDV31_004686 [Fusarium ambrosium]|uniref:Uncharacterized protein n=1 Tax=Fusarium ambrosium TaxID=131363 RepID=A0A428UP11_9HYPO|nr:hypothetical protein CDV31_004686 [Fusarium ambrosium]
MDGPTDRVLLYNGTGSILTQPADGRTCGEIRDSPRQALILFLPTSSTPRAGQKAALFAVISAGLCHTYIPRTITRHLILSPAASIDAGIQATSAPSLWLQPSSAYVVGSHQSRPSAYHCATHAGNTIQHYSAPVRSITHHRPPVHQPFSQPGPDLDPCFLVPVLLVDPEDARRTRHRHRAPVCKKETNKVTYHHPQHPPTLV